MGGGAAQAPPSIGPIQPLHRGRHLREHPLEEGVVSVQEPVARDHAEEQGIDLRCGVGQPIAPARHHRAHVGRAVQQVERGQHHLGGTGLEIGRAVAVAANGGTVVGQLELGARPGHRRLHPLLGHHHAGAATVHLPARGHRGRVGQDRRVGHRPLAHVAHRDRHAQHGGVGHRQHQGERGQAVGAPCRHQVGAGGAVGHGVHGLSLIHI